jgi:hypothetical protein
MIETSAKDFEMEKNILIKSLAHISKNSSIVHISNIEKLYDCFEPIVEKQDLLYLLGFITSNSLDNNWDKLSDKSRRNILDYMKNCHKGVIYNTLIQFEIIRVLIAAGKIFSGHYRLFNFVKNNLLIIIFSFISSILAIIFYLKS